MTIPELEPPTLSPPSTSSPLPPSVQAKLAKEQLEVRMKESTERGAAPIFWERAMGKRELWTHCNLLATR